MRFALGGYISQTPAYWRALKYPVACQMQLLLLVPIHVLQHPTEIESHLSNALLWHTLH